MLYLICQHLVCIVGCRLLMVVWWCFIINCWVMLLGFVLAVVYSLLVMCCWCLLSVFDCWLLIVVLRPMLMVGCWPMCFYCSIPVVWLIRVAFRLFVVIYLLLICYAVVCCLVLFCVICVTLVTCCLLCAFVDSMFGDFRCWIFVVVCYLLQGVLRYIGCIWSVTCCWLLIVLCWLPGVGLFVTDRLIVCDCCVLLTVYYVGVGCWLFGCCMFVGCWYFAVRWCWFLVVDSLFMRC